MLDSKVIIALIVCTTIGLIVKIVCSAIVHYNDNDNEIWVTLIYRVQEGDTLWGLSSIFHCSTRDIQRWNSLEDGDKIFIGQILKIPYFKI